jgi:hypothetical protein
MKENEMVGPYDMQDISTGLMVKSEDSLHTRVGEGIIGMDLK